MVGLASEHQLAQRIRLTGRGTADELVIGQEEDVLGVREVTGVGQVVADDACRAPGPVDTVQKAGLADFTDRNVFGRQPQHRLSANLVDGVQICQDLALRIAPHPLLTLPQLVRVRSVATPIAVGEQPQRV